MVDRLSDVDRTVEALRVLKHDAFAIRQPRRPGSLAPPTAPGTASNVWAMRPLPSPSITPLPSFASRRARLAPCLHRGVVWDVRLLARQASQP